MAHVEKNRKYGYTIEQNVQGKPKQVWVGWFATKSERKEAEKHNIKLTRGQFFYLSEFTASWAGPFDSFKEAAEARAVEVTRRKEGKWQEPSSMTLREYLEDKWLPMIKRKVKDTTYDSYEVIVRVHLVPQLGHIKLSELTAPDLVEFYASRSQAGTRSKTVKNIHVVGRKALQDAYDLDMVPRNVAAKSVVKPPSANDARRYKPWVKEELQRFLWEMRNHRFYLLWLVESLMRLRRGEACGITLGALDLDKGDLYLSHQIKVIRNKVVKDSTLKTDESSTVIPIPHALIPLLRKQVAQVKRDLLALGVQVTGDTYLFPNHEGGHLHPETVSQAFERAVKRLELPKIRLHDLGKVYVSLQKQVGTHPKIVQANARHSSITMTMDRYDYAHEHEQRQANDKLAEWVLADLDQAGENLPDDSLHKIGESGTTR